MIKLIRRGLVVAAIAGAVVTATGSTASADTIPYNGQKASASPTLDLPSGCNLQCPRIDSTSTNQDPVDW